MTGLSPRSMKAITCVGWIRNRFFHQRRPHMEPYAPSERSVTPKVAHAHGNGRGGVAVAFASPEAGRSWPSVIRARGAFASRMLSTAAAKHESAHTRT